MLSHAFQFVSRALFDVGETNTRSRKAMEKIGGRMISRLERQKPDGTKAVLVTYEIQKSKYL
jgi:hypothetical protein